MEYASQSAAAVASPTTDALNRVAVIVPEDAVDDVDANLRPGVNQPFSLN